MKQNIKKEFNVLIEKDADGYYIASVPNLKGCHTQAKTLEVLLKRIREAITLCLEVEKADYITSEFVGIQKIAL